MGEGQFFRAGVGAVIRERGGLVLALERADISGAWQLPQGGLDAGEEPDEAVRREIEEETGIASAALRLVARYPELLAYELPPEARSAKTGRGQVHYWFLFGLDPVVRIRLPEGGEFRDWRWMRLEELAEITVGFRRPAYRRLAAWLAERAQGEAG